LTAAALTGRTDLHDIAAVALGTAAPLVERFARFAGWSAASCEALIAGPLEIAVVDSPDLAAIARLATSPGAVVVTGGDSPLLVDRPAGAAYVCRSFVCDAPTTDPVAFAERVGARLVAAGYDAVTPRP
jgi:uncharacterized protein